MVVVTTVTTYDEPFGTKKLIGTLCPVTPISPLKIVTPPTTTVAVSTPENVSKDRNTSIGAPVEFVYVLPLTLVAVTSTYVLLYPAVLLSHSVNLAGVIALVLLVPAAVSALVAMLAIPATLSVAVGILAVVMTISHAPHPPALRARRAVRPVICSLNVC